MTKEIIHLPEQPDPGKVKNKDFKGYTIEELRYQRALVAMRREFCKSKAINTALHLKKRGFMGNSNTGSRIAKVGGLASRLMSGLSYLDYAMLGMSLFGSGKKIYNFFRRKK